MKIINNTAIIDVVQNSNDILPELAEYEYRISTNHPEIDKIQLHLDPLTLQNNERRIVKLNYKKVNEHYEKAVVVERSARFSITEKCNYKCFFCHEEGLEMTKERHDKPIEETFEVLDKLKQQSCTDFTFTGGEPLLKFDKIVSCLNYMQSIDFMPEITIVTNGEAITDKVIKFFTDGVWLNKIRFNISMHSLDEVTYGKIVEPDKPEVFSKKLSKVQSKLALLRQAGITFKLNFVLLKGLNTQKEQLYQIINYALECGATHVKLLELLITEKLKHFYPYFYKLDAIFEVMKSDLTYVSSDARRNTYRFKDTSLFIELQTCSCAQGCNVCLLNRHMNFTAENQFFPCFLHPEVSFDTKDQNFPEVIEKGEQFIIKMGRNYGDFSPILIKDGTFVKKESNYYYSVSELFIANLRSSLKQNGIYIERVEKKEEFYVSDQIMPNIAYIDKYVKTNHESEIISIKSIMELDDNLVHTTFNSDLKEIINVDIQEILGSVKFNLIWEFEYFTNKNNDIKLSIGRELTSNTYFIRTNTLVDSNILSNCKKVNKLPVYILSNKLRTNPELKLEMQ